MTFKSLVFRVPVSYFVFSIFFVSMISQAQQMPPPSQEVLTEKIKLQKTNSQLVSWTKKFQKELETVQIPNLPPVTSKWSHDWNRSFESLQMSSHYFLTHLDQLQNLINKFEFQRSIEQGKKSPQSMPTLDLFFYTYVYPSYLELRNYVYDHHSVLGTERLKIWDKVVRFTDNTAELIHGLYEPASIEQTSIQIPEAKLLGWGAVPELNGGEANFRIYSDEMLIDSAHTLDLALEKLNELKIYGISEPKPFLNRCELKGNFKMRTANFSIDTFRFALILANNPLLGTPIWDYFKRDLNKLLENGICYVQATEKCNLLGPGTYGDSTLKFQHRVGIGNEVVFAGDLLPEATQKIQELRQLNLCF